MRKLFAIILALALALSLAGCAAAEEPQNDATPEEAKPFEGMWMDDRAVAQLIWEEEGFRILIQWSSSAEECTEWEYSCVYDKETNTLVSVMENGSCREVVYDENGEEKSSTTVYEDGTATFSLDEEGRLIWKDAKEDAGKDLHFIKLEDDPFEGVWEADRASLECYFEEEGYRVMIHWASSATEATVWEYSCLPDEEGKTLVSMPTGLCTNLVFNEAGEEKATEKYSDGAATFSLDEEGHLIWKDEKEDAGKDLKFVLVNNDEAVNAEDDSQG